MTPPPETPPPETPPPETPPPETPPPETPPPELVRRLSARITLVQDAMEGLDRAANALHQACQLHGEERVPRTQEALGQLTAMLALISAQLPPIRSAMAELEARRVLT